MGKLDAWTAAGQPLWLEGARRALVTSGDLESLVRQGLGGVSLDPVTFRRVILGSLDYDTDIQRLLQADHSPEQIRHALTVDDIRACADLLLPVYETSQGRDGYVNAPLRTEFGADLQTVVQDARMFVDTVERPNLMLAIPATSPGISAMETLLQQGVAVNASFVFSVEQFTAVLEAMVSALEFRIATESSSGPVYAAATCVVNRLDRNTGAQGMTNVHGSLGLWTARRIHARLTAFLATPRWKRLEESGCPAPRVVWSGILPVDPVQPLDHYLKQLPVPHTILSVSLTALPAFRASCASSPDTESPSAASPARLAGEAQDPRSRLAGLQAQQAALREHDESADAVPDAIRKKSRELGTGHHPLELSLGTYWEMYDRTLSHLNEARIMPRIWGADHTVWKPEPTEISNRLGWLTLPEVMGNICGDLEVLARSIRDEGNDHVLLMGMGGSSLAPEVLSKTFGASPGYPELSVLDTTDPDAVLQAAQRMDLSRTVFIVSTKSGTTVETLSGFKYFYNRVAESLGSPRAGSRFLAVTDPGSALETLGRALGFRAVLLNDPNVGGRYSALSYVGLLPAALMGLNVRGLLDSAMVMVHNCGPWNCPVNGNNLGARIGTLMGRLARSGRDKLTFVCSSVLNSFCDWLEQLIAESTGKQGTGILPVVGEPLGSPEEYGDDRLFVHLRLEGDEIRDAGLRKLENAGHPVLTVRMNDIHALGGQFFLWEMATAVAGACLGVNPFDQPDVEAAKIMARNMLAAFQQEGGSAEPEHSFRRGDLRVWAPEPGTDLAGILNSFLAQANPGDYVAFQAYLNPSPATDASLLRLRTAIRRRTRTATTAGYGPRFLHSTGQLHKGDAGKGLFVLLTADPREDAPIPDDPGSETSTLTFHALETAQALGDMEALKARGRRVIRIHLGADVLHALQVLEETLDHS